MGFGGGPGGLNPISNPINGVGYNPISNPIDGSTLVILGDLLGSRWVVGPQRWLCDPIEGLRWPYGVYGASGGLNPISNPINGVGRQPHIQPY